MVAKITALEGPVLEVAILVVWAALMVLVPSVVMEVKVVLLRWVLEAEVEAALLLLVPGCLVLMGC